MLSCGYGLSKGQDGRLPDENSHYWFLLLQPSTHYFFPIAQVNQNRLQVTTPKDNRKAVFSFPLHHQSVKNPQGHHNL
jgi:hypothetical protein